MTSVKIVCFEEAASVSGLRRSVVVCTASVLKDQPGFAIGNRNRGLTALDGRKFYLFPEFSYLARIHREHCLPSHA